MQKENVFWIDTLRALATISVIILHSTAPILTEYGNISFNNWMLGNIIDSSVRFCVPIFLMISGALLLSKAQEFSLFFSKRITRVIYPFIFWTLIYIVCGLKSNGLLNGNYNNPAIYEMVVNKIKYGASFHLWFIYLILSFYLLVPILSKWTTNSSLKEIRFFLIIWVFINLPIISEINSGINFTLFSKLLGYPILGYFLLKTKKLNNTKFLFILIVIGFFFTVLGTYYSSKNQNSFSGIFYSYNYPNVIISSIGIFLLFKKLNIKNLLLKKIILLISKYSYGIYLAHAFVIIILDRYFSISWSLMNPIFGICITSILCLFFSILISHSIHKIPFGNYISGVSN